MMARAICAQVVNWASVTRCSVTSRNCSAVRTPWNAVRNPVTDFHVASDGVRIAKASPIHAWVLVLTVARMMSGTTM
uniref:LpqB family beta-propeller domain-containing protein n=2 Tax=Mycolicibacterium fortuitum TaxID=1766 RepID=UPI0037C95B40